MSATLAVHAIERCSGIGPDTTHGLALRAGERIARYVARLGEAFDLVLAPSRALQRRLIDSGVRHVLYQPLGVDTATFHPRARDECWRAGLGIPAGARLLLYAGRFAPEKNMPQLEAAIQRLGAGGSKRATHPSDSPSHLRLRARGARRRARQLRVPHAGRRPCWRAIEVQLLPEDHQHHHQGHGEQRARATEQQAEHESTERSTPARASSAIAQRCTKRGWIT